MPKATFESFPLPKHFTLPAEFQRLRTSGGTLILVEVSQDDSRREFGFIFELTQELLNSYTHLAQLAKAELGVISICSALRTANCGWLLPKNSKLDEPLARPVLEIFGSGNVTLSDYMPCSQMLSVHLPIASWERELGAKTALSIYQNSDSSLAQNVADGHFQLVIPT